VLDTTAIKFGGNPSPRDRETSKGNVIRELGIKAGEDPLIVPRLKTQKGK